MWPVYQHQQLLQVLDMDEDGMELTLIQFEVHESSLDTFCNHQRGIVNDM